MPRTHGGRRPGSGPKPSGKPHKVPVSGAFTPAEIARIENARQPGESRAACIRRLVLAALERIGEECAGTGL
jgi:hypothetical protein